mgnify:CR=1 FL=1
MTKLSIIIPTMQKDLEVLNKLLLELVDDNSIAEIIIIDNSTKGFSYDSEKVILSGALKRCTEIRR